MVGGKGSGRREEGRAGMEGGWKGGRGKGGRGKCPYTGPYQQTSVVLNFHHAFQLVIVLLVRLPLLQMFHIDSHFSCSEYD